MIDLIRIPINTEEIERLRQFNNKAIKIIKNTYLALNLRKYYLGQDSIEDLTYSQFQEALIKFQKETDINILEKQIIYLELGCFVELDYPITTYLSQLRHYPKHKLETHEEEGIIETIYFRNKQRVLTFYDKIKELKKSNTENILRYEYRTMKAIQFEKEFNLNHYLQVKDLLNKELWIKFENTLLKHFNNIEKVTDCKLSKNCIEEANYRILTLIIALFKALIMINFKGCNKCRLLKENRTLIISVTEAKQDLLNELNNKIKDKLSTLLD